MSNLASAAYDTSASIGKTFVYIKFISVIIIACILSIIGGSIINASYKNKDGNTKENNEKMYLGSGFLAFASCIVIVGLVFTYLTSTFKPFAALQGASDVVSLTKNVF
jgi:putative Mn2+ efflux pump MntP